MKKGTSGDQACSDRPIKVPNNYEPLPNISPPGLQADSKAQYRQCDTRQKLKRSETPAVWSVRGANNGFPATQAAATTERFEPVLHVKWLYLLKANNESSVSHCRCEPAAPLNNTCVVPRITKRSEFFSSLPSCLLSFLYVNFNSTS